MTPEAKEYAYQNFIGWDQLLNTFCFGSADETLSSRCWRTRFLPHIERWRVRIDWFFQHILRQGPDHCMNAYIKDVKGRHLPYKFFDEAIQMNIEFDRSKLGNQI